MMSECKEIFKMLVDVRDHIKELVNIDESSRAKCEDVLAHSSWDDLSNAIEKVSDRDTSLDLDLCNSLSREIAFYDDRSKAMSDSVFERTASAPREAKLTMIKVFKLLRQARANIDNITNNDAHKNTNVQSDHDINKQQNEEKEESRSEDVDKNEKSSNATRALERNSKDVTSSNESDDADYVDRQTVSLGTKNLKITVHEKPSKPKRRQQKKRKKQNGKPDDGDVSDRVSSSEGSISEKRKRSNDKPDARREQDSQDKTSTERTNNASETKEQAMQKTTNASQDKIVAQSPQIDTDTLNARGSRENEKSQEHQQPGSDVQPEDAKAPATNSRDESSTEKVEKSKEELLLQQRIQTYLKDINDPYPDRLVNPLLELPRFPTMQNPPVNLIPNGAEIWNLMDIYFPKPRSFPLVYLANLLGFDLSKKPLSDAKEGKDDPSSCIQDIEINVRSSGDKFQTVPPLGMYSLLWAKQKRDGNGDEDWKLDYVDKSWTLLLKRFSGFKSKLFKLATDVSNSLQKPSLIPTNNDCLTFARSQEIIGNDVTFRYAECSDEDAIKKLKNKPSCLSGAWDTSEHASLEAIGQILKSNSQFIIVAECDSDGLLGCIHYSFNWYKLRDDEISADGKSETNDEVDNDDRLSFGSSSLSSKKKDPELVLCINSITCSDIFDKKTEGKDSEEGFDTHGKNSMINLSVVFSALALEHGKASNIWYGLIDSPKYMADTYSNMFRMKQLSKSSVSSRIPLVCDIIMYSYRFAFLVKGEMDKKESSTNSTIMNKQMDDIIKERMLVTLPKMEMLKSSYVTDDEKTPHESSQSLQSKSHGLPVIFSNVNATCRSKSVRVRVDLKQTSDDEGDRLMNSIKDEKQDEFKSNLTILKPENIDSKPTRSPSWKVLRIFPKPMLKSEASRAAGNSDLLSELKKLQKESKDLEKSLEPKLQEILKKAIMEEINFGSNEYKKIVENEKQAWKEYSSIVERKREADTAWQRQMEQDMDAVCDICNDGEINVDNQILFCEACNVAVHQKCYGIEVVPEGDYFCKACRFFNRDKNVEQSKSTPLHISCELCPRRQGAFVQTETPLPYISKRKSKKKLSTEPKWVHVVCAKWQGLDYSDRPHCEKIESTAPIKDLYRQKNLQCLLCKSFRGAMHNCREPDCENWVHVTCARSSGLCVVVHGDNHEGDIEENPWTLLCPDHSGIENPVEGSTSLEHLRIAAEAIPDEPIECSKPKPKLKQFPKMNGKERKEYFNDDECEDNFFDDVLSKVEGARCSVCNTADQYPVSIQTEETVKKSRSSYPKKDESQTNALRSCPKCKAIFHPECVLPIGEWPEKNGEFLCDGCAYIEQEQKEGNPKPQCHMCNQSDGYLVEAFARPTSKKRWNKPAAAAAYNNSLFGKQIWCHAICGMWHPNVHKKENKFVCSDIIMADGQSHTNSKIPCFLCGYYTGAKVACKEKNCVDESQKNKKRRDCYYHVTCARQAGLEVSDREDCFSLRCYKHKNCEHALRAKLEDFIEFERTRAGPQLENRNTKMKLEHAGALLHWAVYILGCLGWAWRWAEWWVWFGDTWEPLLEEGQDESMMTDEELLRVPSDRESRCTDARKCRLAALGAALRNRDFDDHDDGDRMILDKALRAVLNTPSLVGPWKKSEIDFFADWLGRAYRSRSPLLGFGEDKIPVFDYGRSLHIKDSSKKFELGCRTLPGKEQKEGEIFEHTNEIDDFLIPEALNEPPIYQQPSTKKRKRELSPGQPDQAVSP